MRSNWLSSLLVFIGVILYLLLGWHLFSQHGQPSTLLYWMAVGTWGALSCAACFDAGFLQRPDPADILGAVLKWGFMVLAPIGACAFAYVGITRGEGGLITGLLVGAALYLGLIRLPLMHLFVNQSTR